MDIQDSKIQELIDKLQQLEALATEIEAISSELNLLREGWIVKFTEEENLSELKAKIIQRTASAWILHIDLMSETPDDDVASIEFRYFEVSSLCPRRYGEEPWDTNYYEFQCDGQGSVDVKLKNGEQSIKLSIDGDEYRDGTIILKAFKTQKEAEEYRLYPDDPDEEIAFHSDTRLQHITAHWDPPPE